MNYFMNRENVDQYKEMLKEYDASITVNKLEKYLKNGSSLLELGMGAGLDLDLLAKNYKVIGTDNSDVFVQDYKLQKTGIPVQELDAINVDIDKKFDCIYSNKVLQHLTKENFITSLKNQKLHLNDNGIIFMTLWKGEYQEELMFDGQLRFTYYLEDDIKNIVGNDFKILNLSSYAESDEEDSILVVLQK